MIFFSQYITGLYRVKRFLFLWYTLVSIYALVSHTNFTFFCCHAFSFLSFSCIKYSPLANCLSIWNNKKIKTFSGPSHYKYFSCYVIYFFMQISWRQRTSAMMITVTVRACLQGGRWPQVGGVTRLSISSLILTWSRLHDKWGDHIRDYMDRRITSLTWGPPPPCKQALRLY